jgi:putative nucleotidyltransferase with HDIG domain
VKCSSNSSSPNTNVATPVAPWSEWIRSGAWRTAVDSSVPMLPALAHEAIAVAADAEVTIGRLSQVVAKDPILATRVVQLANAAYCAPLKPVTTLSDAMVRMGTAAVRNMVIAACLASRGRDDKMYGENGRAQIDHAIGTAYMAHLVADHAGWNPDEAFLAGLLHDIGKLLLLKLAHDWSKWHGTPVPNEDLADVLATEHAVAGALLLRASQFPRSLIESVLWHHQPEQATENAREAEVVYLADRLSHRYGFGCDVDETPIADDPRCARLDVSEEWIAMTDVRAPGLVAVARVALA